MTYSCLSLVRTDTERQSAATYFVHFLMSARPGHPDLQNFAQRLREPVGLLVADGGQSADLIIVVGLVDAVPLRKRKRESDK